jgi:predicted ATPase with chaperone activity
MTTSLHSSLLAELMSDEVFRPAEPQSIEETGLSTTMIEDLICKHILAVGSISGREIADRLCLPFAILDGIFRSLRGRQIIVHTGAAQLGDYNFALTEQGRTRAQALVVACGYTGPAPVALSEYLLSVEAQTIRAESPRREQLEQAFHDISVNPSVYESLGPAVNSGAGMFLYGEPGNGKTTLARRITSCFGQHILVPRTIVEDGQLIKLFDAAYHEEVVDGKGSIFKSAEHDRRWVKIRRPTVIVGGELTLDALEIRHDPRSNVSEAPIQMKSNCGCLLIDDFGRQRVDPLALLNRWIVPLENRVDYLTLATGKKIQVPFEQLIIFSTNLEPSDLVDEAFLRRIPYKIEITDPDREEFHRLFQLYAGSFGCSYDQEVVDYLLETHYQPQQRALRRCHPRDLLSQVRNYCRYHDYPMEMRGEYFDVVVGSYFTVVNGANDANLPAGAAPPANWTQAIGRTPAAAPVMPPPRQAAESAPPDPRMTSPIVVAASSPPVERFATEAMPHLG